MFDFLRRQTALWLLDIKHSPWANKRGVIGRAVDLTSKYLLDLYGDNYEVDNTPTTFSEAVTHSASTNGTMTGSDGTIKWRPHNLLTYSEELNTNWTYEAGVTRVGTASITGPDGGTISAVEVSVGSGSFATGVKFNTANTTLFSGAGSITAKIWARAKTGTVLVRQSVDGTTYSSDITLTTDWQLLSLTDTDIAGFIRPITGPSASGIGGNIYIWGAHAYRSDLGGMVDNPDRSDSYVPTTSSAVYLPRRGHHIYNGYEWVNEGLLHESEARTNLFTNSLDMGVSFTPYGGDTETRNDSGKTTIQNTTTATSYEENTASGRKGQFNSVSQTAGVMYTYSQVVHSTNRDFVGIGAYQATVHGVGVRYQLSTGISQTFSTGTNGTIHGHNLEDLGNGWYRISLTYDIATTAADLVWVYSFTSLTPTVGSYGTETYAGTAGYKTYWDHTQIEVGATPSSYIPTSGATVTRAAESLIIPAANLPWPTPNVIGSELVTNGTFDTDTSGWTGVNATLSIVSGVLRVTSTSGGSYARLDSFAVEVGKVYRVSADVSNIGGTKAQLWVGSGYNLADWLLIDNVTTASTISGVFTATSANAYLELVGTTATGQSIDWDNISVKEIDPLSVSIQMNGRMTYADDDATGWDSVIPWRWYIDGNNQIFSAIRTHSTRLGEPFFHQENANVVDEAVGLSNAYSPGVFVPFNIASRHGSTFVNGAVDGVALTANTTPTALPDLSATDLNLGYDFMGTIQNFQIWDRDIGDTGLVDETAPSLEPSLFLTFDGTTGSYTVRDWSE